MPQSLAKVYLHIVFGTKYSKRLIHNEIRANLHAYMVGVLSNLGCYTEAIYANPDHIHILTTLPRTKTIAEIVAKVKSSSSKWLKTQGLYEFKCRMDMASFL